MKICYLIVEKDQRIRNDLSNVLDLYPVMKCESVCASIQEAVEYLAGHTVNVVFMNYEMGDPVKTGDAFYMCSYWNKSYPDMMTVLYGNDPSQAYLSIQVGCCDFFRLPVEVTEIQRVISRIRYRYDLLLYKIHAKNRLIMIRTRTGYQLIERNNILFVERTNRRNRLITAEGREVWLAGYSMDELENLLSDCGFYRCYQSFIVNLEKVTEICVNSEKKLYTLRFANYDGDIILSREKYSEILEMLKERHAGVSL